MIGAAIVSLTYDAEVLSRKTPGWEDRLEQLLIAKRSAAFEFGGNDCCLAIADAVETMTGIDHAEGIRGTYGDEQGALAKLEELGGLIKIAERLGCRINPRMAQAGDVGIVSDGERRALALCIGDVWIAPSSGGQMPLPFEAALLAWRV